MKIYLVGGAVRDKLLGLPIKEKDWVVVGASVNDMINKGFRQVGKDFPVFIHPKTGEEYALARQERKVSAGYKGFDFETSPNVSLEDDLIRRDLTINAIAEDENGQIIDPYHGQKDLDNRLLKHVSPAFAEDPVRILRIARFWARFADLGFRIADETKQLMQKMVKAGEVDALVAERVWKELQRALTESHPEKFFEALSLCGALDRLFPNITMQAPGILAISEHKNNSNELSRDELALIRFATVLYAHPQGSEGIQQICQRYKVPNDYRQLAKLVHQHQAQSITNHYENAEALLELLSRLDVFRRAKRFAYFLECCKLIATQTQRPFSTTHLERAADIARSIDIQALLDQGLTGPELAQQIKAKRLSALKEYLKTD